MPFSRAVKPFLPTATLPLFRAVDKNRTILPLYQKKIPESARLLQKNGTSH